MREGCGEQGLLDFRISILCLASLCRRAPASNETGIWSQNENCGCHPLLCRTLRSFHWAGKPANQSGGSSACWPGDRSTGAGFPPFRSVRPRPSQRAPPLFHTLFLSFFTFLLSSTLLTHP